MTNSDEGDGFSNVWGLEELRWWIIDRFLQLPGAAPDNSTSPATWGKYEGTYVSTTDPATSFTFSLNGTQLSVAITPDQPTATPLVQGGIDVPYEGGDLFNYVTDPDLFLVQFFPDETNAMHYAFIYSTVAGPHLAVRAP